MFATCQWLNEPRQWALYEDVLKVATDHGTDFWRETHYGFVRDNGHAFLAEVPASFTAQLKIRARYSTLYDQAGLMVRLDDKHWVKVGAEYNDGKAALSTVLTTTYSDWSTGPFEENAEEFWIRATVAKGVLRVQASADGLCWPMIRLCPFPQAARYKVGPMCCTPERAGLEVEFSQFSVSAPLGKELHDLT